MQVGDEELEMEMESHDDKLRDGQVVRSRKGGLTLTGEDTERVRLRVREGGGEDGESVIVIGKGEGEGEGDEEDEGEGASKGEGLREDAGWSTDSG